MGSLIHFIQVCKLIQTFWKRILLCCSRVLKRIRPLSLCLSNNSTHRESFLYYDIYCDNICHVEKLETPKCAIVGKRLNELMNY